MKYIFGVLTLLLVVAVFIAGASFITSQSPAQFLYSAGVIGSLAQVESQPGVVGPTGKVKGIIDKIDKDASGTYVSGWACQTDVAQSINIHVYAGGPAGSGTLVTSRVANVPSAAGVSTACGTSDVNHRFRVYLSDTILRLHQGKEIYIHGIPKLGKVENALLHNSGKFKLPIVIAPSPTPVPPPTSAPPEVAPPTPVPPPPTDISTKFSPNNRIVTSARINLRATPAGTILGQQPKDSPGTVATPPSSQNGIKVGASYWWYLNFDTGVDGWGAEQFLVLQTTTPPPPPISTCPANIPAPIIVDADSLSVTKATASAAEVDTESLEEGETETTAGRTIDTAEIYENQLASATPAAASSKVATASGRWSDAVTWGGSVPTASDNVRIPAGVTVMLDTEARAATVEVNGVLRVVDTPSSLTTRWIMVMGAGSRFTAGTAETPLLNTFTLELTGNNTTENIHGAGSKFLMAMDGGEIRMHGQPQISWTKLYTTAAKGASQIKVSEPVAWAVGDQIVIAPSTLNPNQAEVRTITGRSSDCLTLILDKPLDYRHVGVQTRYTRPTDGKSWVLDQRAEVGLLTHNVKVQGSAVSESTGFGAHVMIMKGAKGHFSNIELYRVGQKKVMGRYPIHWHMAENTSVGQYIKNSSIHNSYNRAITLHGSEGVLVERNVAFDHMGHGIFLEDASERFNKINYNLVMMTRKPAPGDELLPSDNELDQVQNRTPASFWITNPNNEFIGNVAAGTVGTGFWFAFPDKALGLSAKVPRFQGMVPRTEPLGIFKDNVAHSSMSGFDVHDSISPTTHQIVKNRAWSPSAVSYIDNFTLYANNMGLYSGTNATKVEKVVFRNVISADMYSEHVRFAHFETVQNSLFVADSGNRILPSTAKPAFYALYDGAGRVYRSHFVGFDKPNTRFLKNGGASVKQPNHLFSGLTFDPKASPYIVFPDCSIVSCESGGGNVFNVSVVDIDGSLTGKVGSTITSNHPIMLTKDSVPWSNGKNAYVSPHKFKLIMVGLGSSAPVTWKRTGGGEPTVTYTDNFVKPHQSRQLHAIDGAGFTYTYTFNP